MAGFQLTPERFGNRLNLVPGLPETVRAYSVTGDGNTDDYAALNEVAIKFGTTGHIYFPAGTYRVGTNLTFNCLCEFAPGATFDPDSGVTVTLAGPVRTAPGSSIVASGTTGTVSITGPMDAGSGVLNVKAFGAVGDGVTDDTAAIQAAIDAAFTRGGGVVLFPEGTYISDQLGLKANVSLQGEGRECTTLVATTASETVFLKNANEVAVIRNAFISDLGFLLPTSGTAATTLIRFKNVSYSGIRRCRLNGQDVASCVGLVLEAASDGSVQAYYNAIETNQFLNLSTAINCIGRANANSITNRNVFLSCVGTVIVLNECNNVVIHGNAFQDNSGQTCIQLTGGSVCQFNVIQANKFEGQDIGVQLDSGVRWNSLLNNVYSIVGVDTYLDNSGTEQCILESYRASLNDVGQIPQLVRVLSQTSLPTADDTHRGAFIRIPGNGTTIPDAIFVSVDDAAGAVEWVRVSNGAPADVNVFADADTSPDVNPVSFPSRVFRCANTGATSITTFENANPGDVIHVILDANTTLVHSSGMQLQGDLDVLAGTRRMVTLVNNNGQWIDTGRRSRAAHGSLVLQTATPTTTGTDIGFGNTTSTTVGAAGAASALPATPSGYLTINVGGTAFKVPYYAS